MEQLNNRKSYNTQVVLKWGNFKRKDDFLNEVTHKSELKECMKSFTVIFITQNSLNISYRTILPTQQAISLVNQWRSIGVSLNPPVLPIHFQRHPGLLADASKSSFLW